MANKYERISIKLYGGGGVNTTLNTVVTLDDKVAALEESKNLSLGSSSFIQKKGSICFLQCYESVTLPTWTSTTVFTLPEEYWPPQNVKSNVSTDGGISVIIEVGKDGNVTLNPFGNALTKAKMYGSITYICKD